MSKPNLGLEVVRTGNPRFGQLQFAEHVLYLQKCKDSMNHNFPQNHYSDDFNARNVEVLEKILNLG